MTAALTLSRRFTPAAPADAIEDFNP
ncbi:hypothetical protein CcrMagneto_gp024 [Caulobacter virus Magneto]|nr:hypothetical protein CcrMagneto_gp024 [Caulobacter virus Magneto]AFU87194.1 hypothetical protein CcrMagneto_gp024 [Caulobacter virus Magneto]